MLDDRRCSLVSIVEDGLSACSLRKLAIAGTTRSPLSTSSSSSSPSPVVRLQPRFSSTTPSQPSPTRILNPERNQNNGGRKTEFFGRVEGVSADDGQANGRDDDAGDVRPTNGRRSKKGVDIDIDIDVDIDGHAAARSSKAYAECAAAASRAVKAVRYVEGAAAAAEREYAKRTRDIVLLRAAVALRERNSSRSTRIDNDVGDVGVCVGVAPPHVPPAVEREGADGGTGPGRDPAEGGTPGTGSGADGGRAGGVGGLVGCGGCAVLFAANERLLQEARVRGIVNE